MNGPRAKDSDDDDHDYKWLVARERGEDTSHVPTAERAPYEQLDALLGSGMAPRAGFRQRVLDAIDAEERREGATAEPASIAPAAAQAQLSMAAATGAATAATTAAPKETAGSPVAAAAIPGTDAGAVADAVVVPIRSQQPAGAAPERPAEPKRSLEPRAVDEAKVVPIRKKSPRRWIAAGGLAAAAAVAVVLFATSTRRGAEPAPQLAVKSERRAGSTVVRSEPGSEQASIGDRIVVRAQAPGSGELRVYGGSDERLIASCKHPGDCALEGDGEHRWFVLEVELTRPGTVRSVVFTGERIPASTGSYASDLEAAQRANVDYENDKAIWRVL